MDFVQTAASELDGTSGVAGYGPPYNNAAGSVQKLGPFKLPDLVGVRIPIDTAKDFVLDRSAASPARRRSTTALVA